MKAEEPGDRVPIVKYGMGAEYQDTIVQRHFAVTREQQLIDDLLFRIALDRLGKLLPWPKRALDPTPPLLPVTTVAEPLAAEPSDLRRSLGLG